MKSDNRVNDLRDLSRLLENVELAPDIPKVDIGDNEITGGRMIRDIKSNQLFTGRFEEHDVRDFVRIWSQYRTNNIAGLKNQLIKTCDAMIRNYRGEVCPAEVMLYTSNTISSSFSNYRLAEEIADVVYLVWKKDNRFLSSIAHIVSVWEWVHVINICAMAVGQICGDFENEHDREAIELMHDIFDRYRYDDATRHGCFVGAIATRRDEFIPDILNVVHDLSGTDADKRIGNLFKNRFFSVFTGYYTQLNAEMFADSSQYARDLVRKILQDGAKDNTLVGRYQKASSQLEKKEIIEEGFARIRQGQSAGIYDAVNMLKGAGSDEISTRMMEMLRLDAGKSATLPVISYFGSVSHAPANKAMRAVPFENDYYAACRIALFRQNVISGDELMEGYLSETRAKQLRNYLSGFAGLNDKVTDVKNSAFAYFSREDLSDEKLRCALVNYERLVRKYKHLYNPQIGELFKSYFGYGTVFGTVQLRMTEQNTCLSIIEMIIDSSNYKKYEDFLYFVAEQGISFAPTITSHASNILRNINSDRIKM